MYIYITCNDVLYIGTYLLRIYTIWYVSARKYVTQYENVYFCNCFFSLRDKSTTPTPAKPRWSNVFFKQCNTIILYRYSSVFFFFVFTIDTGENFLRRLYRYSTYCFGVLNYYHYNCCCRCRVLISSRCAPNHCARQTIINRRQNLIFPIPIYYYNIKHTYGLYDRHYTM